MANPAESFKKLPSWGKAAVAGGGVLVVYLVWRSRSQASASANTAASAASNIDPQTGYPTGSTSDLAALQSLQSGFPVQASSAGVTTTVGTTSGYGTNAAWAQAAEAGLSQVGFDPQAVAEALGAYLNGQTLTAGQASIVFAATAEFGAPPVSPPNVVLGSSSGPAVTGNTAPGVSGGHVISLSNNDAVIGWTGSNAASYRVTRTGPGGTVTNTVTAPQASYSGLAAGHNYEVTVVPVSAGGVPGTPGRIDFKTTKGK